MQCNRTVYEPILSYAQLSKFNLDRIALSDDVRRKIVETKFMSAMETSQRVVETIVTKDEYIMNNILTLITKVQENVNSTKEAFRSGETFSKYFRVMDLFSTDDTTWKKEKAQIEQMTYVLTNNIYSFNMEGSKLYDFYTRLRGVLKINKNNESKVVSDLQRCAENRPRHPIYGTTFNPHTDFPTGLYVGAIRSVDTSPPSIVKKSQITEDQNSLDDKETQLSSPIRDESEASGSIRYARSTKDDTVDVTSGIKGETGSSSPPVKKSLPDGVFRHSSGSDILSGEPDHFFSDDSYLYNSRIGSVSNAMQSTNNYVEVSPSVSSPSSSIFMRQISIFPGDDPFGSGDDPLGSGDGPFGSGEEHPFPPHFFCDYWNYVDTDNYMAFTENYDVYRGGESLVQQIMPEVDEWKSRYRNMIKAIFDGSYISVDSFPEHEECIKALDAFNADFNNTLRRLGNNAERFFSCYNYDICSTAGPNLVNSIVSLDVEKSKASLDKCNWVYETWSRETASGRYSDVESALATVNQHSNNIKQSFKNFVKGIEALPVQLQTSLAPLEEMLKLYLSKNLTKAALASNLTSRTIDNSITEILDLQNNIKNVLNELVNSVDSMWTTVANLYETILDRDIPLVKPSGILELEFPGLVTELNRTKRHLFLNTLDMNDAQYVGVVIETLDLIFKNYSSIFYDIHEKQVHVVMDLVAQIDDLSDDLYNYLTALKMDKDFIM